MAGDRIEDKIYTSRKKAIADAEADGWQVSERL